MDAGELFRKGQLHLMEGELQKSIDAFTGSIEGGERTEIVFLSRGVAYFKAEDYDRAIQDFDTVIDMNDQNFRAYFYRGTIYLAKEEYERAIEDFNATIRLKSDHGAAFFARATAYLQLGREEEAKKSLQSAIACSEATMQWIADHYGMFRTQFDKAIALISGQELAAQPDEEQMRYLAELLKDEA